MIILFKKFKNWLQHLFGAGQEYHLKMPPGMVKGLLVSVENTLERELTCGEVFAVLDHYAEITVKGESPEKVLPLVHHHIEMCPDCREEFEALLRILTGSMAT